MSPQAGRSKNRVPRAGFFDSDLGHQAPQKYLSSPAQLNDLTKDRVVLLAQFAQHL
jgi:hypothetical protein